MKRDSSLVVVWASLLFSMLIMLGMAFAMRPRLQQGSGLGVLTWMAIAWCVLATVTAALLRSMAAETGGDARRRRGLAIASFGLLESAAVLAALSHLLSPFDYGIYAAFIPMAAMLAFFPRAD